MHSVMVIQVAPMMYFALKIEVGRGAISHIHALYYAATWQTWVQIFSSSCCLPNASGRHWERRQTISRLSQITNILLRSCHSSFSQIWMKRWALGKPGSQHAYQSCGHHMGQVQLLEIQYWTWRPSDTACFFKSLWAFSPPVLSSRTLSKNKEKGKTKILKLFAFFCY